MTGPRETTVAPGARDMNLYSRYFDLVAAGRKKIEVRVQYPKLRNLKAGDHIRFVCGRDAALAKVKRVARYGSFRGDARHRRRRRRQPRQPVTSNSPISAASTDLRRKPSACSPSRSNSSTNQPFLDVPPPARDYRTTRPTTRPSSRRRHLDFEVPVKISLTWEDLIP
jgi:hypothetical protein